MKNEAFDYYIVKMNCPHATDKLVQSFTKFIITDNNGFKCKTCSIAKQNWICVTCCAIECSRYANGHMVSHNKFTSHPVAYNISQSSFWCYTCSEFIDHPALMKARAQINSSRFKNEKHEKIQQAKQQFKDFGVSSKTITYFQKQDISLELLIVLGKQQIMKLDISMGDRLRLISHLNK